MYVVEAIGVEERDGFSTNINDVHAHYLSQ